MRKFMESKRRIGSKEEHLVCRDKKLSAPSSTNVEQPKIKKIYHHRCFGDNQEVSHQHS